MMPTFQGFGPSREYDNGDNPSVAISGNPVVEVQVGGDSAGPLWYRVGRLDGSLINWGPSNRYDNGYNPSVAFWGLFIVEVHVGGNSAGQLWYRTGRLNGLQITWRDSVEYDSGWNPKIAFTSPSSLIEVHNGQEGTGTLWYHDMELVYVNAESEDPPTIGPRQSHPQDSGCNTAVAGNADTRTVVEVHNGADAPGPMWYHTGTVA